jgi:serine/threonine protein kinase
MIGVSVGQYECRNLLGEGGSGTVYLAIHRVLGTPRAVKVLLPEWNRYPEIVERFINEARAAAAIRHRNIIGVHDCGRLPSGEWFILFDYLEGGTLASFIGSHGGPVALHDVIHILAEVANGVQAAHDHEIVHRDLKPDNIYLSNRDGDPHYVTILDFGVAKLGDKMRGSITGPGSLVGTPAYMAPEQLRGSGISPAVDVFALGVIAYQMVSGGWLPFQLEPVGDYYRLTAVELYQRITSLRPNDPRRYCAELPEPWIKAICSALDPDPVKRPTSPREFALMLAEATAGDGFSPSGLSLVRTYARELLEIGVAAETVRAPTGGSSSGPPPKPASRYQVTRQLGTGGMAEVFEGAIIGAEGFARRIAIKRVRSELSREPAFAAMFIEEARMASQLSHPNVVSVLDFDRDTEDRLFLVMEYVDGEDLAALLRAGRIPAAVAIFVASEVLRGLAYAHESPGLRGLVHRDLSPHNVLLSREGAVKVSDFGIAKVLAHGSDVSANAVSGKPAYMSPEQVHSRPLDARSDLFSVGIILWEMLTGHRLFKGTHKEILAQVLFKEIPSARRLQPEIPADLDAVIMKLLVRDRTRRYANATLAIEALLACAEAPRDGRGALVQLFAARSRPGSAENSDRGSSPKADASIPTTVTDTAAILPGAIALATVVRAPTRIASAAPRTFTRAPRAPARNLASAPSTKAVAQRRTTWLALVGLGAAATTAAAALAAVTLDHRGTSINARTRPPPSDSKAAESRPLAAPAASQVALATLPERPAPTPSPETPSGILIVAINPWAAVWVDGKAYGETPIHVKLPPGTHRVRIANQRATRTLTVKIIAAKSTLLERDL